MNLCLINTPALEFFTVIDSSNNLVNLLDSTSITVYLINPAGFNVASTIPVTITQVSNGHYVAWFVPNMIGTWMLTLIQSVYFPWGKSADIQVYGSDFDTISSDLDRIMGLVHQNMYIDEPTYDSDGNLVGARVRIYSNSASVGTLANIIATYQITSNGIGPGKFSYWQQVEI
jgi:hypothetical protein